MNYRPEKIALIIADWPEHEKYCPNFTGMQDGLNTLKIAYKTFSCRPVFDPQPVIDYNPDLVVYGLPDMGLHPEWRLTLKYKLPNAKFVMWYGDWRSNLEVKMDLSEIDLMVASNNVKDGFYEKHWKVPRYEYLPLGASIKKPKYNSKFDFPVVFLGQKEYLGWKQSRANKLDEIQRSDIDLRIIHADPRNKADLRLKIMKSVPEIYFSSKISLDISHFSNIKGYTSNRCWIIPACGGFAISEYWPGCEEFFPKGTRVWFNTIEEGIDKIKYYLTHDDEREKLRLAGMKNAINNTYDKRWLKMFEYLNE